MKQLRALATVQKTGSLTAAAGVLTLTTPAIHSQIKGLETALATQMLTRSPNHAGLVPTAQGKIVIAATKRIDAIMSQMGAELVALSQGKSGRVTLGVVSTAKYFAPGLVRTLNERCPDIDISLVFGNRETIIASLARGALGLAIKGRPPRPPEVVAVPLGPNPHGIVVPPGHPLALHSDIDPDLLLRETFIAREPGSGTRILTQHYLGAISDGRQIKMIEMDSNETIKQAVIAGLGIAMRSLHTVGEELHSRRLCLLKSRGLPIMRHWYLVHLASAPVSAAAAALAAQIVALNGTFLPR